MEKTQTSARDHLLALLICTALISALFAPIVFGGKTLSPAMLQPDGLVNGRPYGYTGRAAVNTFNVDLATPAYYEWPVNKTVGDIYKKWELPLWNPYQAGGTPLAADYSTRAFFPYQVIEDISPVPWWDFFLLGRLLIAGFFSYLFLALTGAGFGAALLGAVFYMFSGVFAWFVNLEQFSNVAMTLPPLMLSTELLIQRQALRHAACLGAAVALTILAGQPEAALYVLFLAACYFLFRAIALYRGRHIISLTLKALAGLALGLLLASPLILPFIEYAGSSYNMHAPGGAIGMEYVENWKKAFSILAPSATEVPADPSIVPEVLAGLTEKDGAFYYRVFATKGLWDYLGGYTGVASVFLAVAGFFAFVTQKEARKNASVVFFAVFGASIVLKDFGVSPFIMLGKLPFFDQAWSPRWAGPAWVFAFSASGAYGLDALLAPKGRAGVFAPIVSLVMIGAVFIFLMLPGAIGLAIDRNTLFDPFTSGYVIPAILLGNIESIVMLAAVFILTVLAIKGKAPASCVIAAAVIELWWDIPRGYDSRWLYMKTIPFVFGLTAAFFCKKETVIKAGALAAVFFISFFFLDRWSPHGLPERFDPFKNEPPYAEFLRSKEKARVAGGYGVLMPNYAGSLGIEDLRYVNALITPEFLEYRRNHLQTPVENEEAAASALWFTGMPQRITIQYDGRRAVRYAVTRRGIERDIVENLNGYSLMGTRFFLMPAGFEMGNIMPLVYDREIRIYENTAALARAFTVTKDGSVIKPAVIKEYRANRVTIEAATQRPSVLVLGDTYSPGWKAFVNGIPVKIEKVNGVMRGVELREGMNTVVFIYRPASFVAGCALAFVGALISVLLVFKRAKGQPA